MRIVKEIIDEELVINVYADEGKVFARKSDGKKLGTGRCNHLVFGNDSELEKYVEVKRGD